MDVNPELHDHAIHEVKKALGLVLKIEKEGFSKEYLDQIKELLSKAVTEFYDEIELKTEG